MATVKEDLIQSKTPWAGRAKFDTEDGKNLTNSGLTTKGLYTKEDLKDLPDHNALPGEFPYGRGCHPSGYRSRLWTRRQYAGFGSSLDSNQWFKNLMAAGQMGLSVALDLPTQMGLNSTDPNGKHEVGRVGVAIDSLADMESLFDGIPLDKVSTSFTINGTAAIILAMYLVTAEKQGVKPEQIRGTVQNDILKEFVARGCYLFAPEPSMRLVGDVLEYCISRAPKFNAISIAGGHIRSAGATMVQCDAYKLANAIAYCDEVTSRGFHIDQFGAQISWLSGSDRDFFESICRLRAMRIFWAKTARERYGSKNPKTQQFKVHTGGDCDSMTFERPMNNIARSTLNCLSNVLGGTQSMQLPCYDEAYEIPTEDAIQNALDIQMIVAYESGAANVTDPLAGSYYVESLTQQILDEYETIVNEIVNTGGSVQWITEGRLQRKINEEAYLWEKRIKSGGEVRVGANFACDEKSRSEYETQMHPYSDETLNHQTKSIEQVMQSRDNDQVKKDLADLKAVANGTGNLMEPIMAAVRSYATMAEICDTLKQSFGTYHVPTGL